MDVAEEEMYAVCRQALQVAARPIQVDIAIQEPPMETSPMPIGHKDIPIVRAAEVEEEVVEAAVAVPHAEGSPVNTVIQLNVTTILAPMVHG